MSSLSLFAQPTFKIGMTVAEFEQSNPGILPQERQCHRNMGLPDTLEGIPGNWSFTASNVHGLTSAQFHWNKKINDQVAFENWVGSVDRLIGTYTKRYGAPSKREPFNPVWDPARQAAIEGKGRATAADFCGAEWQLGNLHIEIHCRFGPSSPPSDVGNSPSIRYGYGFAVLFSTLPQMAEVPLPDDLLHLGMSLEAFAKMYPQLFPNGIQWNGNWDLKQAYAGLDGHWNFEFKEDKLHSATYFATSLPLTEAAFHQCRVAALQMVSDMEQRFGPPVKMRDNVKDFNDALIHRGTFETLLDAEWSAQQNAKVRVGFVRSGGKAESALGVSLSMLRQD